MDDNKLEAKLLKIKALAERGEGGEKEAAIKMYHKLLKKYDIDEKALQKDKLSKHWFTYETDIEENLLVQIFYMVTGDPEYFRRTSRTRGTQCGCICTDFEKTEIRFYFEFYKDALNQELDADRRRRAQLFDHAGGTGSLFDGFQIKKSSVSG